MTTQATRLSKSRFTFGLQCQTSQTDEHIPDVAVQAWAAAAVGVMITAAGVLHLNKYSLESRHGRPLRPTDATNPPSLADFRPTPTARWGHTFVVSNLASDR